ncbi:cyclase family protein [Dehalococcoidia bacterium]|nr:cyclase family protein [Dehalococcoidia bacterium]
MNINEFVKFADGYKNWGKWGEGDETGTLNYVRPEHIIEACKLVKRGQVFALAIPFDESGPQRPRPESRRFNPIHTMLWTGFDGQGMTSDTPPIRHTTDDMITMPLQGGTQWDALAHVIFQGKMYNGHPYSQVDGNGAHKNGIEKIKEKPIGRGVLLDIPRHLKKPWLAQDHNVTASQLNACAVEQGVDVREGDFLLVRTGHIGKCRAEGSWGDFAGGPRAGLGLDTIPWLFEKRVASISTDTYGVELNPSEVDGLRSPLHLTCIANMGMLFGEIFDLEALAQDCSNDKVYEFLFVAPPLPVTGAVGSPINPYAIK